MAFRISRRKCFLLLLWLALASGAGVIWLERASLLAWVYVQQLARADESSGPGWVERVANLGEDAIGPLLERLQSPEPGCCQNVRAALDQIASSWGPLDRRTAELTMELARCFPRLSAVGQQHALALAIGWLSASGTTPAAPLGRACSKLLGESAEDREPGIQASVLDLCAALLARQSADLLPCCRNVLRANLQSRHASCRVRAIQLVLAFRLDLLDQIAPLLQDPVAEVRQVALLAVGPPPADQVVRDESLLPALHDSDPEVRRLCEAALRARGLRSEHLQLGRLLTDPNPVARLQVLDHLFEEVDLDSGLWLRRLSHDPSPAVRAAAARAMTQQNQVDLSDRLDQMARSDPSPTVCALARFYFRCTGSAAER